MRLHQGQRALDPEMPVPGATMQQLTDLGLRTMRGRSPDPHGDAWSRTWWSSTFIVAAITCEPVPQDHRPVAHFARQLD